MRSETLPSACYILSDESSIPFYSTSNGYKKVKRGARTDANLLSYILFSFYGRNWNWKKKEIEKEKEEKLQGQIAIPVLWIFFYLPMENCWMVLTLSRPPFRRNSMARGGRNFLNTRYLRDSHTVAERGGVRHSIATIRIWRICHL